MAFFSFLVQDFRYEFLIFFLSTNPDALKMSLTVCNDVEQFSEVIQTLIDNVNKNVNDIRTQLVLSVLLNEGKNRVAKYVSENRFSKFLKLFVCRSQISVSARQSVQSSFDHCHLIFFNSIKMRNRWNIQ